MSEMKPVPCGCGGEAIIGLKEWEDRKGNYHENSFVYCNDCSISTGGYLTEAEAVTAWNTAMGWGEPKWWCNLCASYDKQRCYCNLHGIWVASDFGCKAFGPYCEGEDTDEDA